VFPTAEVRWFWPGDAPDAALTWLRAQNGDIPAEETRTDHYLRIDATDTLGVKLREGHIELKQRTEAPRPKHLTDHAHGLIERWVKWSFGLARERPVLRRLVASQAWVGVKKRRWLKEYRVTPSGSLSPHRADGNPAGVCGLEITQVTVSNAASPRWWTLGLEASGDADTLTETLHRTAEVLLAVPFPAAMTTENSYSYPQWLRLL
jgi:hypothetical protein